MIVDRKVCENDHKVTGQTANTVVDFNGKTRMQR